MRFSFEVINKFGEIKKGKRNVVSSNDYSRKITIFNMHGIKVEYIEYDNNDEIISRTLYEHDKNGNLKETTKLNSYGNIERKFISNYDEKGNEIESSAYNSKGTLESKDLIKYDKKDGSKEISSYNSKGNLSSKWIIKYEKAKMAEVAVYKPDNSLNYKWDYIYDNEGNATKSNDYDSDGIIERSTTSKYDSKGNVIEEYSWDSLGNGRLNSTSTNEYEYDEMGNWIKKIKYNNRIPQYINEREIIYFD